jgi:iron complex outermembrane receptor protein
MAAQALLCILQFEKEYHFLLEDIMNMPIHQEKKKKFIPIAVIAIAGLLYGAFLAELALAAQPEEEKTFTLPTVTVTANKQTEDLQKVPQSITVISGEQAQDAHLTKINDLGLRVPNLIFATGGMQMINLPSMRGVNSNHHSNIPSVIMYIDDVPVSVNAGYVSQLYDIASIEILRGPQGTLYGRNSEGGVIKITTNKPGPGHKGQVTMEAGSKDYLRSMGSLSGELIEGKLFAGGSFQFYGMDGWVKNDFDGDYTDDQKNYSGRGSLRLTPTDDLEVNLTFGMLKYDEGTFGIYDSASYSSRRHTDSQDPGNNRSSFNDQALNVTYKVSPAWTISSVTTRRESTLDYSMDYDFTPAAFFEVEKGDHNLDIGQEFRFTYDQNDLSAVFGAAYNRMDQRVRYDYYNYGMKHSARSKTDSFAGFGQIKIPFAEKWALTAGARVEYYKIRFDDHDLDYSDSDSWTTFSPKLALEYYLFPENSIYLSASRGFRAAGYDTYQGMPGSYKYDEEELWALELGSKNLFWEGKMRLNAALFYHKFHNMQLECYTASAMGPMPTIRNVGSPEAFGGEVELSVMPLAGLELFASTGYTHMRYDDFSDALGDYKDNQIPYVPELTYTLGAQYRHENGFFGRAEVVGATKSYLDSANKGYVPAHALFNVKIGWEFESFDVYIFGNNIFDKRYDYVNAFGGTYGVATEGARFGGMVTYRF